MHLLWFFLQVAHMTKSEMDLLDLGIVGPLLLFVNQYFNCLVNETLVLWICFVSTYIWSYDVESFSTLYIKCCHQLQIKSSVSIWSIVFVGLSVKFHLLFPILALNYIKCRIHFSSSKYIFLLSIKFYCKGDNSKWNKTFMYCSISAEVVWSLNMI